jgi:hypothetical protein
VECPWAARILHFINYYEVVQKMKQRMDSDAETARGRDAEAE